MRKDQVDFVNATVWIPDSKTPNGIAEIPLTPLAIEAIKSQILVSGTGPFLFPSDKNPSGHHKNLKTAWRKTLKRAGVPYFRIYDLRSTYATRLSAGGVADEWVTQMLRQGDAQVFKKYSQMKLQMKREALEKLNRRASEMAPTTGERMRTGMVQCIMKKRPTSEGRSCDGRSNCNGESGAKEPQKDIGKSGGEWHFDLEGKDTR